MAVIQQLNVRQVAQSIGGLPFASQAVQEGIKKFIAKFFWEWYDAHYDDELFEKRILFFKVKIRVCDLHVLFVTLFGEREAEHAST